MIKLFVKVAMLFVFWRPAKWRKSFKMKLESRLYSGVVRRRAKKCGRLLNVLGPGVNVTFNTTIGEGVGFGKNVKIRGDGPVFIGKFTAVAEDTLIYTCPLEFFTSADDGSIDRCAFRLYSQVDPILFRRVD